MDDEVWMPIAGCTGRYEISSIGRVRKCDGKILSAPVNSCGYPSVKIIKAGCRKTVTVHRLVAEHFLPNPNDWPQINHIDGNKLNNRVENLEWCTASQNTFHAYHHGLKERTKKAAAESLRKFQTHGVEAHVKKSSKPIEIVCVSTKAVQRFGSANEAARALGLSQGNLSAVCNGRIKSTGGYTARYIESTEGDTKNGQGNE